jgi:hypothetical protein
VQQAGRTCSKQGTRAASRSHVQLRFESRPARAPQHVRQVVPQHMLHAGTPHIRATYRARGAWHSTALLLYCICICRTCCTFCICWSVPHAATVSPLCATCFTILMHLFHHPAQVVSCSEMVAWSWDAAVPVILTVRHNAGMAAIWLEAPYPPYLPGHPCRCSRAIALTVQVLPVPPSWVHLQNSEPLPR